LPSKPSEGLVTVTVLGVNDPPEPSNKQFQTDEETVLRLLADAALVNSKPVFDTDTQYPHPPAIAASALLTGDTDPDSDDDFSTLRVVGVCQAAEVLGYAPTPGSSGVTVTAPKHGLVSGQRVLISGYGGQRSYNNYHVITVVDESNFTLPVDFDDDDPQKGLWVVLEDSNRLVTTSKLGAAVRLEIRADRQKTNVVYDPRASAHLDGLAVMEKGEDTFYYAVEDRHGAVSLARVTIEVSGVNDAPVPGDNPPGLLNLVGSIAPGGSLGELLSRSEVVFVLPGDLAGTANATLRLPGAGFAEMVVVPGLIRTDEDHPVVISSASLLANDNDVDRTDELRIEVSASQTTSREGAAVTISADGNTLGYNPAVSARLQSLARKERVVDTFSVTVFDGTARVSSLVAVLVEGLNDSPIAVADGFSIPEDQLLSPAMPGLLANDSDRDQNTSFPDDRKILLPVTNAATLASGAKTSITLVQVEGPIQTVSAVPGYPGRTRIFSRAHGLNTAEEARIHGNPDLEGQFPIIRMDDDHFSVGIPHDPSFAAGGVWEVLASRFTYDPRGSVAGPGSSSFTLDGLAEGQSFADSFTYTLLDGSFLFANDDSYRVEADSNEVELRVLLNDTSLDGVAKTHSITAIGPFSGRGIVTIQDGQSLIYTPEAGFVGDEVFNYTIMDDLGNRDTAMVTVRVTQPRLNGNLQANHDFFTVARGQAPLLEVLANDDIIPATGEPLVITLVGMGDKGGKAVIEDGRIRFTPSNAASGFPYTETFAYTISGGGPARADATVTVLVVDRGNTLNVRPDAFSVAGGSAGNQLNVLANDNLLPGPGAGLVITGVTAPPGVDVSVSASKTLLSYTAPPGFLGIQEFEYAVSDNLGGTGQARVVVTVGSLITNSDIFGIEMSAQGVELNVLANDGVLQGAPGELVILAAEPPSSRLGTLSIVPASPTKGAYIRFDANIGETGQEDFVYSVSDQSGRTATANVTLVVHANGVRGSSDFFTVQTGSSNNPLPVLANDIRISSKVEELSIASIGIGLNGPNQGGTAGISADSKQLLYTPAAGFVGEETFAYTVTDGENVSTAVVSVISTDGELTAAADAFIAFRGSVSNRLDVIANDRLVPDGGQALVITAVTNDLGNAANPLYRGILAIAPGSLALLYTPDAQNDTYPYFETFTYEISDGGVRRAGAVVRIEVLDRAGTRTLETNHDRFSVRSDSRNNVLDVLANDSTRPATAQEWAITSVTPPVPSVWVPFLPGDFPDPRNLSAEISAQADGVSQLLWTRFSSSSRTLLANASTPVDVLAATLALELNAAISANSTFYNAPRFVAVVLRPSTRLLLEEAPAGELLSVLNRQLLEDAYLSAIRRPVGGGLVGIAGPNLVYTPVAGFVGYERFIYSVTDGFGGTGTAEVVVRSGDVSVSDDRFTALAGAGPVFLDVTANDGVLRGAFTTPASPASSDFTLSSLKTIEVTPASAGTATVQGALVRYTPPAGFSGIAELVYWVTDDGGSAYPGKILVDVRTPGEDRSLAKVSILVAGVNDAPQLLNAESIEGNDKTSVRPFAAATLVDVDDQGREFVRVLISFPSDRGLVSGPFKRLAPGLYEFYGSPAEATAALRNFVFTPFENRIPVGETEGTTFVVSMDDGKVASPVIVDDVQFQVTPVNEAPRVSGTVSDQLLYRFGTLKPFAGVNIVDVDNGGLQTLQVMMILGTPQSGNFANTGGFVEQTTGSGIYVFSGTAANASAALRGMVFVPNRGLGITPGLPQAVGFNLSVSDGFAPPVLDSKTSIILIHAELGRILPRTLAGENAPQAGAGFGSGVAVSGNTLVVGAPHQTGPGLNAGRVMVYDRNAGVGTPWGQVAELVSKDLAAGDRFGQAVAIDGDFIVVGAPQADPGLSNAGALYVFHRSSSDGNNWSQVARLVAPGAGAGDALGSALAIQGFTILSGAPFATTPAGFHSGKVHVFNLLDSGPANWGFSQTLGATGTAPSGSSGDGDYFGHSIAFDGNTAVIGAPGDNRITHTSGWDYGSAYVFERTGSTWAQAEKLNLFDHQESRRMDRFGSSVAISNNTIAIGVPFFDGPVHSDSGLTVIYTRPTSGGAWTLTKRLIPSETSGKGMFGASVALSGKLLVVGAPHESVTNPPSRGSAFIYQRDMDGADAWGRLDGLMPNASGRDLFGSSCAIDGFVAAVGAPGDEIGGFANAGSTWLYQFQFEQAPRSVLAIPDQVIQEGQPFVYAIPAATFVDPVYPGVSLEVTLANGQPLPVSAWIKFNPLTRGLSGIPVPGNNRDYSLIVHAINPTGSRTPSNVFEVKVLLDPVRALQRSYGNWAAANFSTEALENPALQASLWGPLADADGDGAANVFEMLYRRPPSVPDPPALSFSRSSGSQVSVTFPRSTDVPMELIHVEWSNDMKTWSRANVGISAIPAGSGLEHVTATVYPGSPQARIFVRLTLGE